MNIWAKLLLVLLGIFLIIQIPVFAPDKNYSEAEPVNDIGTKYDMPMDVMMDFNTACYNCHSNYTENYPWYYHIQPVSWWMNHHINEAKAELNFSEFATYSPKKTAHKFHDIQEVMEDKTMPINSYLWMHDEAKLSDETYKTVAKWAGKMHDQMKAEMDSLKKR